jgi:hypothetical protein
MTDAMVPISGFPNYLIGQDGSVFSRRRVDRLGRKQGGKFLKPKSDTQGYLQVCLIKDGKLNYRRIHRLVAGHFLRMAIESLEINHRDGDKTNNNVSNLEACTARANINHRESEVFGKQRWGVFYVNSKRRPFWVAKIRINGKQVCLGSSRVDPEPLYELYRKAYFSIHGSFPW